MSLTATMTYQHLVLERSISILSWAVPPTESAQLQFVNTLTWAMDDMLVMTHEFQTLGTAPRSKRGCIATHMIVAGICTLLGAALNEAVRPGGRATAPSTSLQNHSLMPPCGGRLFGDAPGELVLISYQGRKPIENTKLASVQTAETFEVSFDVTPLNPAPSNRWASVVDFRDSDTRAIPGVYFDTGSTRLVVLMHPQDGSYVTCGPTPPLPVGQVTHVGVRLVGDTFSISLNGQEACSTGGFYGNRLPAQPYVNAWFSNPWNPAADVTVANLVYTSLYACGPVG